MPNGLVPQFVPEGRPADIVDGLRHAGFGEPCGIDIADNNVVIARDDPGAPLVQEVVAPVGDPGVNRIDTPALARALGCGQRRLGVAVKLRRRDDAPSRSIAQRGQVLQTKVDANATLGRTRGRFGQFDNNIDEPIAAPVAREIAAIGDLALRQTTRVKHAERVTCEAERVAMALELAAFERHPRQRLFASIAQTGTPELRTRSGVLLAYVIDGSRMQAELPAGAGRQLDQVEPAQPRPIKTQGIFLPVIAVVPNEVDRAGLSIQQASVGFDTVTVDQLHTSLTNPAGDRSRDLSMQRLRCSRLLSLPALNDGVSRSKIR